MITLYLDMDGVLSDFEKAFHPMRDPNKVFDKKLFAKAVTEYKIFQDLDMMPNAMRLLSHVRSIPNINVELLTSVGTHDPFQGDDAKRQKIHWLQKHGIDFKPNFVRSFSEKKNYADWNKILIDDRPDCADPFTRAGGHGILHNDKTVDETLKLLDSIILQIRAIDALKGVA